VKAGKTIRSPTAHSSTPGKRALKLNSVERTSTLMYDHREQGS